METKKQVLKRHKEEVKKGTRLVVGEGFKINKKIKAKSIV